MKKEIKKLRDDYAKSGDFCAVFERDMKSFYLLAFLLTVNHKKAELCFEASIDEACTGTSVFKSWVEPWAKRCLIARAIQVVFCRPVGSDEQRNLWSQDQGESRLSLVFNAVTGLEALERFVFVMAILEGYSTRECSLLLNCTKKRIVELRGRASCRLAASETLLAGRAESA